MKQFIKAVIFDFGGVLSKTLFETHRQSEQVLGISAGALNWYGPFQPKSDSLWQAMQRCEITERNYWLQRSRETGNLLGESWSSMHQMIQRVRGDNPQEIIREEAKQCVEQLHSSGLPLAILSNELDLFYGAKIRNKLPILNYFKVIVDGTYTKVLKPRAEAYKNCLMQLGLDAENCLFVDDQLQNILGAKKMKLPTVHFDITQPVKSFEKVLNYV